MPAVTAVLVAFVVLVAGCAREAPLGAEHTDGHADTECTDPRYGDGTCHATLSCAQPDIDCFEVPANEASADFGRDEREYPRARALLDRAWADVIANYPVGDLADARVALVLLRSAQVNAEAGVSERGMPVLRITLNDGLLRALDDDGVTAVLYHELGHLLEIHAVPGVIEGLERVYVAGVAEPIGRFQPDDPVARAARATLWSIDGTVELNADGGADPTSSLRRALAKYAREESSAGGVCADPAKRLYETLAAATASGTSSRALLDQLAGCAVRKTWSAFVRSSNDPAPWWLIEKMAAAGVSDTEPNGFAVVRDMIAYFAGEARGVEATLRARYGRPVTALRYFSYEESADDFATRIARATGMDLDARAASFRLGHLDPCEALTALPERVPDYGGLGDPHHGWCWRADHARRYWAYLDAH